jgi:hypothetical protein
MNGEFRMTLNSPLTKEDWAKITDANMEHTKAVTFQTEGGEKVEFTKVVRCKDCKYGEMRKNCYGDDMVDCSNPDSPVRDYALSALFRPDWFCADGERREDDASYD